MIERKKKRQQLFMYRFSIIVKIKDLVKKHSVRTMHPVFQSPIQKPFFLFLKGLSSYLDIQLFGQDFHEYQTKLDYYILDGLALQCRFIEFC